MPSTGIFISAKSLKKADGTHLGNLAASIIVTVDIDQALRLRILAAKGLILLAARVLGWNNEVDVHQEQQETGQWKP